MNAPRIIRVYNNLVFDTFQKKPEIRMITISFRHESLQIIKKASNNCEKIPSKDLPTDIIRFYRIERDGKRATQVDK